MGMDTDAVNWLEKLNDILMFLACLLALPAWAVNKKDVTAINQVWSGTIDAALFSTGCGCHETPCRNDIERRPNRKRAHIFYTS